MNARSLLSTLQEYDRLGIPEQIDYKKFYLYSIITHSTAIEGSTVTEIENQLPSLLPANVTQSGICVTQNVTQRSTNDSTTATSMLTPRQQQILQMMQADDSVSASTMAAQLGITIRTVRRDIEALRHHYNIQWLGSSKQGHWQILPQNNEQ